MFDRLYIKKNIKMIEFRDLPYTDKRQLMNEYVYKNVDAQEILAYVIYHSYECNIPFQMDRDRLLRKLLIDGYVAYEKIYNKQSQLIGYNELEPTTLIAGVNNWIQYNDIPHMKRILFPTQVIYLTYNDCWLRDDILGISLVDQIMNDGLSMKNVQYLNIIADYSYRILQNFDPKLLRRAKLERLCK